MTRLEQLCERRAREIVDEIPTAAFGSISRDNYENWMDKTTEIIARHLFAGATAWKQTVNRALCRKPEQFFDMDDWEDPAEQMKRLDEDAKT